MILAGTAFPVFVTWPAVRFSLILPPFLIRSYEAVEPPYFNLVDAFGAVSISFYCSDIYISWSSWAR